MPEKPGLVMRMPEKDICDEKLADGAIDGGNDPGLRYSFHRAGAGW
jgi:hypothetical protein